MRDLGERILFLIVISASSVTSASHIEHPRAPPQVPTAWSWSQIGRHRTSTTWVPPGFGPSCRGAWTGELPEIVRTNTAKSPALLEYIEAHQCPYGKALIGEVTWPMPPEQLRDVVGGLNVVKFVAVLYSYVPYLVALRVAVSFLYLMICGDDVPGYGHVRYCGTKHLSVVLWVILMVVLQEAVFKPYMKQPRPGTLLQLSDYKGRFVGSCLNSCGMPSSHSALAMGWFSFLFLDTVFRVRPAKITGYRLSAAMESEDVDASMRQKISQVIKVLIDMGLKPWSSKDHLTQLEFNAYIIVWGGAMLPVPIMRAALYDHTIDQAIWGMVIGGLVAVLWWRLCRFFQHKYVKEEDKLLVRSCWLSLKHDLKLPKFAVTRELIPYLTHDLADLQGMWVYGDSDAGDRSCTVFNEENLLNLLNCGGIPPASDRASIRVERLSLQWILHGIQNKRDASSTGTNTGSCSNNFFALYNDPENSAKLLHGNASVNGVIVDGFNTEFSKFVQPNDIIYFSFQPDPRGFSPAIVDRVEGDTKLILRSPIREQPPNAKFAAVKVARPVDAKELCWMAWNPASDQCVKTWRRRPECEGEGGLGHDHVAERVPGSFREQPDPQPDSTRESLQIS